MNERQRAELTRMQALAKFWNSYKAHPVHVGPFIVIGGSGAVAVGPMSDPTEGQLATFAGEVTDFLKKFSP